MEKDEITYSAETVRDHLRTLGRAHRRGDAAATVRAARAAALEADRLEMVALDDARAKGTTWAALAEAIGYSSPQAVQQRHARLIATWCAPEVTRSTSH